MHFFGLFSISFLTLFIPCIPDSAEQHRRPLERREYKNPATTLFGVLKEWPCFSLMIEALPFNVTLGSSSASAEQITKCHWYYLFNGTGPNGPFNLDFNWLAVGGFSKLFDIRDIDDLPFLLQYSLFLKL